LTIKPDNFPLPTEITVHLILIAIRILKIGLGAFLYHELHWVGGKLILDKKKVNSDDLGALPRSKEFPSELTSGWTCAKCYFRTGREMFCTNCGASLPDQARFCNQCGRTVQAILSRVCLSCGAALTQEETACGVCGARHRPCPQCGRLLAESALGCPGCGRLLRVPAGYELIPGEFEHPSMQQMNQTLRRSLVLNRMAESISRKVGKPWYESCFNSVQVTEKQYARVFELAMITAQRVGLTHVPAVYIEADRGYQSNTYGSEKDAFVNIGTFLPKLLNDRELMFILGHEFGHLKCRHALWMTVSLFLVGQTRSNIMSEGILGVISNPLKLIEGGVESVILSWMRVADLTADRVALLICGDIALARRTLFLLYFKSRKELDEVNIDEWTKQQEAQDLRMAKVSQLMASSTPYLGLRLRALEEFYRSPRYAELRNKVESGSGLDLAGLFDDAGRLKKCAKEVKGQAIATGVPKPGRPEPAKPAAAKPSGRKVKMIEGACPKCGQRFALPFASLPDKPAVELRCKQCRAKFKVNLSSIQKPTP
jgi:Zn-dependent protease with chaperone function